MDGRRTRSTSPGRRRGPDEPHRLRDGGVAAPELEARDRLRRRRGRLLVARRRERRGRHACRSVRASDACQRDWAATDPTAKKQFPVNEFVDYFAGLGRPLGAAFIFPAAQTSCSGTSCTAGLCCQTDCPNHANVCIQGTDNCGAQAPGGHRLVEAANTLRNRGADVITGSVCDPELRCAARRARGDREAARGP